MRLLFVRAGVAATAMGLVVIDFFPQPAAMTAVIGAQLNSGLLSNRVFSHSWNIRFQNTAGADLRIISQD